LVTDCRSRLFPGFDRRRLIDSPAPEFMSFYKSFSSFLVMQSIRLQAVRSRQ
jgi:hypothetical protein